MGWQKSFPEPEVRYAIDTDTQRSTEEGGLAAEEVEFFVPRQGLELEPYLSQGDLMAVHHLARYQWAIEVIRKRKPKRILDIACGAGYGSYLIAQACPNVQVIGGDYDAASIRHAQAHYSAPNLRYQRSDMVIWRTLDAKEQMVSLGEFDMIISFDTIEHLLHREIALLNLTENLSDKGALLFSTPSGTRFNQLNPGWEHHKIEYSFSDLGNLMSRFFKKVLSPADARFPAKDYWDKLNATQHVYLNLMNPLICSEPIKLRRKGLDIKNFVPFQRALAQANKHKNVA